MKLHALAASAVALTLASTPASAGPAERDLVLALIISFGVHNNCPGYELVDGAPVRFADTNGVDFDKIGPAAVNSIMANVDKDYDRTKLIPEVSRFVRDKMVELGGEMTKVGKPKWCKKYVPVMTGMNFMKKIEKAAKDDGSF